VTDTRPAALWEYTDTGNDQAVLLAPEAVRDALPADVVAVLDAEAVWLTADAVRDLRDALNRVLVEDGGSEEDTYRQSTLEGAQALHAAQHRQLEAASRRITRAVDEQTAILARLADEPGLQLSATVGTMLGVQRRLVAAFGDLLAAVAGQP
jgi:hypothetical protein